MVCGRCSFKGRRSATEREIKSGKKRMWRWIARLKCVTNTTLAMYNLTSTSYWHGANKTTKRLRALYTDPYHGPKYQDDMHGRQGARCKGEQNECKTYGQSCVHSLPQSPDPECWLNIDLAQPLLLYKLREYAFFFFPPLKLEYTVFYGVFSARMNWGGKKKKGGGGIVFVYLQRHCPRTWAVFIVTARTLRRRMVLS